MKDTVFKIAVGSIPGTDHTMPGQSGWKNNHDAFAVRQGDQCVVLVVCDGCGSGKHSEVGSKLASELLAENIFKQAHRMLGTGPDASFHSAAFWNRVEHNLMSHLTVTASAMGESLSATVENYFLFAFVGMLVTPRNVYIFSVGDGVYAANGIFRELGPFPKNSPPYIMYSVIGSSLTQTGPEWLKVSMNHTIPTDSFEHALVGTDGVLHFVKAENDLIRGTEERIGPLSQFWENDVFFENPDMVRRRLARINCEYVDDKRIKAGPLKDDMTLAVVKKFKLSTEGA